MDFELVWFNSMGANSSCTLVTTTNTGILIDLGAAIMQPRFQISELDKWVSKKLMKESAKQLILKYHVKEVWGVPKDAYFVSTKKAYLTFKPRSPLS